MRRCATTLEAEMTPEEHALLLGLLRSEQLPGAHLEIGTAAGGTLCAMMQSFDEERRPKFVVVDRMNYFPDQMGIIRRNLTEHGLDPQQVDFRVARSSAAFRDASRRGEEFDFLLIDGCHRILGVTTDMLWTRLLRVGGLVCLHDYCPQFPGVQRSVDRFLARHPNYRRIDLAGTLIALRKQSATRRPEIAPLDRAYALALHVPLLARRKLDKWHGRRRAA